jgi:hypothetical protein
MRTLVLRAIADDYESFDIIVESVTEWSVGRRVDRQAVKSALEQLINEGYAQAYVLSSEPPAGAQPVQYCSDDVSDLWFYLTKKGRALAREMSDEWTEDTLD